MSIWRRTSRRLIRDCYQVIKVLPPLDQVQIEQEKTTLVIVRPGGQANQLPISSDWQNWWGQQQYKNRVLFLTGSRDTFQKVLDSARQARALQSIEDELKSESTPSDDPQWRALDALRDRVGLQFTAALKEAFDQIVYPSINSALRIDRHRPRICRQSKRRSNHPQDARGRAEIHDEDR